MSHLYSGGKKVGQEILLQGFAPEKVGVFESLRAYQGVIFQQDEHLKRLMESAKTVGIHARLSAAKLKAELDGALEAFKKEKPELKKENLFVRMTAWPEGEKGARVFVMVSFRSHPPDIYKNGVSLKTSAVRRSLSHAAPPQAKTTDYLNALMATLDPSPGYEWVFLDRDGFVTEVRIGNLFIVKDGRLFTPPLTGILNGVTRRFVLECASLAGLETRERPLSRHEVYNADEAFLTNTSWEILPVREMDGRSTGKQIPGKITCRLHTIFKNRVREWLLKQSKKR